MLYSCPRLTSIEIRASISRLATPQQLWDLFSSLTLLKRLRLECAEAEAWLMEPEEPAEFAHLFDETLMAELSVNTSANSTITAPLALPPMRPIAQALPNLEYLHLNASNCHFKPGHIAFLPKSLTHFAIPYNRDLRSNCLPYFHECPNIQSIYISVESDERLTGVLAPSITSISFGSGTNLEIPASFWSASKLIKIKGYITSETLLQLPPSIEVIKIPTRSWALYGWTSDVCESVLYAIERNHLLPNLKQLKFSNFYNVARNAEWPPLPKTLEKLSFTGYVANPARISHTRLPLLPQSLTKLTAEDFSDVHGLFKSIAGLSSLTTLRFKMRYQCFDNADFLRNLPGGLTYLELSDVSRFDPFEPICLDSALPSLPRKLKYLDASDIVYYMTSKASKHLPRQLQHLTIGYIFDQVVPTTPDDSILSDHILDLPRTLSILSLAHATKETSQYSDWHGPKFHRKVLLGHPLNTTWSLAMFKNLPLKYLTSLTIHNSKDTLWTQQMIELLPYDLRILYISEGSQLDEEAMRVLPRKLLRFEYRGHCGSLTSRFFGSLPPFLADLNIPEMWDVDEASLTQLPRHLCTLMLSPVLHRLSESSAKFLPPSVLTFTDKCVLERGVRPLNSVARAAPLGDPRSTRRQCLEGAKSDCGSPIL